MIKMNVIKCDYCKQDYEYEHDDGTVDCLPDGYILPTGEWICDECGSCPECGTTLEKEPDKRGNEDKDTLPCRDCINPRILALISETGDDYSDVEETGYDDLEFKVGNATYLVLTDEEANERTSDYIETSIWAFNTGFLEAFMPIDYRAIEKIQELYEDANEPLKQLIEDWDDFVESAISADGRGHFLSQYDGDELEVEINGEDYYIYRT
jgi:hypothetical protein